MRTHLDLTPVQQDADALLVLLAPALCTLEDLIKQGFVAAVRQRQLAVDILLVEVAPQQVMHCTVAQDLQQQVMAPARAAGRQHIWLAGVSIGAYSALHYAAQFAAELSGLTLIAPYPGTADIQREITAAGGIARWAENPDSADNDERIWWKWLYQQQQRGPAALPLHLGLGNQDRFAHGQNLLASVLPPDKLDRIDGDHSWPVWQTLWQRWLDRDTLSHQPGHPR